eukprot:m.4581 g.4581  ORF g.4581 m.4581 type:complete len:216 (-) comp2257_c0_seq1:259-906(-)
MSEEVKELLFKVLVVGDSSVGKTSLIKRYVHDMFSNQYKTTIGVDFALKVITYDENTTVRLQLWDIAGQERYGTMTRVYYREAVGAWVVFDVTRLATFESVHKWKADIDNKVFLDDGAKIPVVLLGNKCDKASDKFRTADEMDKYCEEKGFVGWFETSAKENINIENASNFLVEKILALNKSTERTRDEEEQNNITIKPKESTSRSSEKKEGGCC